MNTLYNLMKSASAACRDLFCFVLAWLLHWASLGIAKLRRTWSPKWSALFDSWALSVQLYAPTLNSPFGVNHE